MEEKEQEQKRAMGNKVRKAAENGWGAHEVERWVQREGCRLVLCALHRARARVPVQWPQAER